MIRPPFLHFRPSNRRSADESGFVTTNKTFRFKFFYDSIGCVLVPPDGVLANQTISFAEIAPLAQIISITFASLSNNFSLILSPRTISVVYTIIIVCNCQVLFSKGRGASDTFLNFSSISASPSICRTLHESFSATDHVLPCF